LIKTLYGLKQAPREWYTVLKNALAELGFKPVSADSSFWICEGEPCIVYLTSVVDDMLVLSENEEHTLKIVNAILAKFKGKHEGRARHYNGMCITWLDKTRQVLLTQAAHVQKFVEQFSDVADLSLPRTLPMAEGTKLHKSGYVDNKGKIFNFELLDTTRFHYRQLIGALNYLANCTRPDITFTVNQLARYNHAPTQGHWQIAIDCLRYLNHTRNWGIKLGGGAFVGQVDWRFNADDPPATAFADANHGTGVDDKKSISGVVVQVLNGPVSWASRVQPVTSTSTTESEFRALSETSREVLWIAKIIKLFGMPSRPFLIQGDSTGAIGAIRNYQYTRHTKHIEIHHDFMKDRYENGDLAFKHIDGKSNPADIFTKALGRRLFENFRQKLGMDCLRV
jgi:Reverse transcriptase (RNA-dependent DNA polymerase)